MSRESLEYWMPAASMVKISCNFPNVVTVSATLTFGVDQLLRTWHGCYITIRIGPQSGYQLLAFDDKISLTKWECNMPQQPRNLPKLNTLKCENAHGNIRKEELKLTREWNDNLSRNIWYWRKWSKQASTAQGILSTAGRSDTLIFSVRQSSLTHRGQLRTEWPMVPPPKWAGVKQRSQNFQDKNSSTILFELFSSNNGDYPTRPSSRRSGLMQEF